MANTDVINLRISSRQKAIIDMAAKTVGQNRTAFILENVLRNAEDVLLDRTRFQLDATQWKQFNNLLDNPPVSVAKLQKLLQAKGPWDKDGK